MIPCQQLSEDSRLTRWTLLERLRDQFDNESWRTFYDVYSKLIRKCARDSELSVGEADEVVEDVLVRAWQTIPDPGRFVICRRPGSFRRWLMTETHFRILDHKRRQRRHQSRCESLDESCDDDEHRSDTLTGLGALSVRAFEESWNRRWSVEMLEVAIETLKTQVRARQFQIFSLNVLDGEPAETVAKCLGVSTANVHLTAFRIKRKLRENLRKLNQ